MDCFRLPSPLRFVQKQTCDGFSDWNSAQRITLLICKLFSNANEYMCSSLKILNIAASAVGLRQAVGRVLSRTQISHGQAKERLPFYSMETCIQLQATTLAVDCSDGNRLQLEKWPFCHLVTYSLQVIGTITPVHTYFIVTSPKLLFRNNDYITLFIITNYNT